MTVLWQLPNGGNAPGPLDSLSIFRQQAAQGAQNPLAALQPQPAAGAQNPLQAGQPGQNPQVAMMQALAAGGAPPAAAPGGPMPYAAAPPASRTQGPGQVPLTTVGGETYFITPQTPPPSWTNTPLSPGLPSLDQMAQVYASPLEQMQRRNPITGEAFVSNEMRQRALQAWSQAQNQEANRQGEFARANLRYAAPGTYQPTGAPTPLVPPSTQGGAQTPLQSPAQQALTRAYGPGGPQTVGMSGPELAAEAQRQMGATSTGQPGSSPLAPPAGRPAAAQTPIDNIPGTPRGLSAAVQELPPYLAEIALQQGMTGQTQRDISELTHGEQAQFQEFLRTRVAAGNPDLTSALSEWNRQRGNMPFSRQPVTRPDGTTAPPTQPNPTTPPPGEPIYAHIADVLNTVAGLPSGNDRALAQGDVSDFVSRLEARQPGFVSERNWPAIQAYIQSRFANGPDQLAAIRNRFQGPIGQIRGLFDRTLFGEPSPQVTAGAVIRRLMGGADPPPDSYQLRARVGQRANNPLQANVPQ